MVSELPVELPTRSVEESSAIETLPVVVNVTEPKFVVPAAATVMALPVDVKLAFPETVMDSLTLSASPIPAPVSCRLPATVRPTPPSLIAPVLFKVTV